MTKTDPVLGCLPLLADVLGRSYGVVVEIGGDDAFTDGRTIRLPALPATADPDFLGLVRGYIDHEAAHIRHTDMALLAAENPNPLEKHIWNSFEDWRVERELARLFPGCAANFRWLIQKMFLGQGDETTLFAVLDWLLYTVRSWAVPELILDRDKLAERVKALWPGLIPRIDPILEAMMISCPDSRACLDYARQVVICIRDVAATMPMARPEEKPEGGSSGKSKAARKGKVKSGRSPIVDSRDIRDLLAASDDQLPEDLGAELRRSLVEGIKTLGHGSAVAKVMEKPLHLLDPQAKRDVDAVAAGLSARLHGLLQATKLVRVRPSRRGVLDPHRLYGIAVGEPKLFLTRQRKPGIDTTVHLLLDTSGSMRKRIDLAGQCCWAVAQALIRSGIPVAITAFAGRPDPSNTASVTPILKPGQRVRELGMVDAIGNTPLGEALWWVLQRLVQRREERKLVIVLTDGVPDNPVAARQAIAAARRIGVEVYGIGIDIRHLNTLMPGASVAIENLAELPGATFTLVGGAVLPGRKMTA